MGCGSSSQANGSSEEDIRRNKDIEKQLSADRVASKNTVKMLLLGTGESGKSTVMKQLTILYNNGFSRAERESYREICYSNTVQSLQAILENLPVLNLSLLPSTYSAAEIIEELDPQERSSDVEIRNAMLKVWSDPAVKEAMVHRGEFQLNDSAPYFFQSIERITDRNYVPTDDDIIRARVRTTGIIETSFPVGKMNFRVFDVGGQRSERRKWLQIFEAVDVLIFVVAISEYDQTLFEDETVARVEEALTLFGSVANSRWFASSSIILFLNKIDLFEAKVQEIPIAKFFPNYIGPERDYEAGCRYFLDEFKGLYTQPKPLYHHFTCSTSTQTMSVVLNVVSDLMIRNVFDSGLL